MMKTADNFRIKRRLLTAALIAVAVSPAVLVFVSLFVGNYPLSVGEVFGILFSPGSASVTQRVVVWQLRLPRALAAAAVGAALSVAGAAYQGVFRNPLVNPGLLGVSNGAGFGACFAIIFLGGGVFTYFFSFGFALAAVVLAWIAGRVGGRTTTTGLILGGVVISSLFGALISIMKYVADPYSQLPEITFWFMGSFASVNYSHFWAFIPIFAGLTLIFLCRWKINVLSMGDKEAHVLGVNVNLYKLLIVGGATLVTASSVCISGTIGWVGLVMPHIGRMLVGNNNNRLIPVSAALGASFMIIIDCIARSLTSAEIPVGILTAIVGTPFFIYLLKKTKGKQWNDG